MVNVQCPTAILIPESDKPDPVIQLKCGEVCTHASYKATRTWENFNNWGAKITLLWDDPTFFKVFFYIVMDLMVKYIYLCRKDISNKLLMIFQSDRITAMPSIMARPNIIWCPNLWTFRHFTSHWKKTTKIYHNKLKPIQGQHLSCN